MAGRQPVGRVASRPMERDAAKAFVMQWERVAAGDGTAHMPFVAARERLMHVLVDLWPTTFARWPWRRSRW